MIARGETELKSQHIRRFGEIVGRRRGLVSNLAWIETPAIAVSGLGWLA
jgi:hypothetical protein